MNGGCAQTRMIPRQTPGEARTSLTFIPSQTAQAWTARNTRIGKMLAPLIKNVSCRRIEKGFTLIEMIIVISIVMILTSIAIPIYNQHVLHAREAVLREDLY